jgi:hypothetical protein
MPRLIAWVARVAQLVRVDMAKPGGASGALDGTVHA